MPTDATIDVAFLDRRHPAYQDLAPHWLFLEQTYEGGRAWFTSNVFRYYKEGDKEFTERLNRAYRFNHTREVVDLVQKYLYKAVPSRNIEAAPEELKAFWKRATLSGLGINQLMRIGTTSNSITGRCAVVVDNNMPSAVDENQKPLKISKAEAERGNYRVYSYIVPARDILDYAFDEDGDGELIWIKLREIVRDDKDPLNSSGLMSERVRLWTRQDWSLYEEVSQTDKAGKVERNVRKISGGTHKLGYVPVKLFDHAITGSAYKAPGLIDDIAYLDRACANYLSNLDAIIQDQTFSQLAIPAQAIQQGDDTYNKVLEMGTKRIFVYDSGSGSTAKPEYLSPDPKQAGVILAVINKIINEIYHTIGLAGERTKQDNAVGIDNSSGVAKAYDFEKVNSLLLSKAQSCEVVENWIARTVLAWNGINQPDEDLVTYPTTFDVMQLADELAIAEALAKINAPVELRREHMREVSEKLFPQLKDDLRKKILDDIKTWLEGMDLVMPPTAFGTKSPTAPSRQGEVTKQTQPKSASK